MSNQNIVYCTELLTEGYPISGGTSNPLNLISSIGMLTIERGSHVTEEYRLKEQLTTEVRFEDEKYIIVDYRTNEYGIGGSILEAQKDLFNSFVGYLSSLEKREGNLGEKEKHNLNTLRNILEK